MISNQVNLFQVRSRLAHPYVEVELCTDGVKWKLNAMLYIDNIVVIAETKRIYKML